LLTGLGAFGLGGTGLAGYAASESWFDGVTHYNLSPPGWPADRSLRIVALADIHACEPFMGLARVRRLVAKANALRPDVTVLLGDYVPSRGLLRYADWIDEPRIAEALGALQAPRGVFAILGNHDWWEDDAAMARRGGPTAIGRALAANGIRVLENGAERTGGADHPVWIAGLGDQWAFWHRRQPGDPPGRPRFIGRDDDVITSSGYRIGPTEIEDCLLRHPAIAQAAVVGKPDALRTEIVRAFVVLRPGVAETPELATAIRDFVKERLSAHEYPRQIDFVADLPLTTTGKVVRRLLRERP
jgi:predicted MPP superfamily phosphohydrolase